MCEVCFDIPINQLEEPLFTQEEQDAYIDGVWFGVITTEALSLGYHEKHSQLLTQPIIDNLVDPEALTDLELKQAVARSFRTNVYEFSAAKQYQQVRQMVEFDGLPLEEFRPKANNVFRKFNDDYLETELNTAIAESQNASNYVDAIENASEFPLIRYKTQNDGRVRDAHRPLNNITLPPNHPFWRKYWPANGWNCRCFTIQLQSGKATDINDVNFEKVNEGVPPLFRKNAAIEGEIFDKSKHPYWDVKKGDTQLKENNFNLPRG